MVNGWSLPLNTTCTCLGGSNDIFHCKAHSLTIEGSLFMTSTNATGSWTTEKMEAWFYMGDYWYKHWYKHWHHWYKQKTEKGLTA